MHNFRLNTLLKLREIDRDGCRARLAEAFHAESVLAERQAALAEEMLQAQEAARHGSEPGAINVDGLQNANRHRAMLAVRKKTLEGQQTQVAEETERRRRELVEADRQVRMLEKLRERQFERHQIEELKKEQKQFDELAAQTARRKDRE